MNRELKFLGNRNDNYVEKTKLLLLTELTIEGKSRKEIYVRELKNCKTKENIHYYQMI